MTKEELKTFKIGLDKYLKENYKGGNQMKQQLKKALENGTLYDFIANNGWQLGKEDLIEIIKNLDYTIYQQCGENKLKEIEKGTIENIIDCNEDFFRED